VNKVKYAKSKSVFTRTFFRHNSVSVSNFLRGNRFRCGFFIISLSFALHFLRIILDNSLNVLVGTNHTCSHWGFLPIITNVDFSQSCISRFTYFANITILPSIIISFSAGIVKYSVLLMST
jgi:hypothetical protein